MACGRCPGSAVSSAAVPYQAPPPPPRGQPAMRLRVNNSAAETQLVNQYQHRYRIERRPLTATDTLLLLYPK